MKRMNVLLVMLCLWQVADAQTYYRDCNRIAGDNPGMYQSYFWNNADQSAGIAGNFTAANPDHSNLLWVGVTSTPGAAPQTPVAEMVQPYSGTNLALRDRFDDGPGLSTPERIAHEVYLRYPSADCFPTIRIRVQGLGQQNTNVYRAANSSDLNAATVVSGLNWVAAPNVRIISTPAEVGTITPGSTDAFYFLTADNENNGDIKLEYDLGDDNWQDVPSDWVYSNPADAASVVYETEDWTCNDGQCWSNFGNSATEAELIAKGSITITADQAAPAIPTMGQWMLFILGLLLTSVAVLFIYVRERRGSDVAA